MKDFILISILCVLSLSCGTVKKKKKTAESPKKNSVSVETKELFHTAVQDYIISDYELATKKINAYLAKNPSDDAAYYLLSKIYYEKKDSIGSIRAIETAFSLDKTNRWYNEYLGYAYLQHKEYAKALENYLFLTKEIPDEITYKFSLFETYFGLKQFSKSLVVLDNIEQAIGVNPETSYQRYVVYINLKKFDLAEKTLLEALQQNPDEHQLLFALNDFYIAKKQPEKMVSYLEDLVAKNPSSGSASLLLSEYYLKQNKTSQAETLLEKVFSDPEVDITYKRYFLMDNFVDSPAMSASLAKKLALTALQTTPNDGFLNLFLGNVFDEAGDVEKALLYYNKAIETNKINHETLARICVLNYQVQNFDSLERMSKIGISLLPSSPDFYYFNAISLLKLKRYDDCIDIAENGLVYTTKNEGKVDLGVIIAEAYFAKKDYQKGKEAYETLIRNNPKDLFLKNNLALILVKHNIELDYADKLINQLSELDPRNQNYQFTKGYILFKKGKYDEAQKFIEPLVNANRKDGSLMNLLGNIFAKKGNIESAVDYWKAAKELGYKNSVLDKKINDKKYYDDVE